SCPLQGDTRPRSPKKSGQWAKCRVPVKYRVIPAAFAAAMVSSSRTEPPGWTTARTPASASTMNPSGNGKYASDAATAPADREPRRVDPVDLSHADPDGGPVGGEQDRVGLHRAHRPPRELQIAQGRGVRGRTGGERPGGRGVAGRVDPVGRLGQHPAGQP